MMHMLILLFLMGFAGCGPSQKVSVSTRDQDSSSTITNSVDHGLIYTANPIVASGNSALTNPVYSSALKTEFITSNDTLMLDQSFTMATSSTTSQTVEGVIPFLEVYETQDPDLVPLTTNTSGTWDYNVGTREFYQVNLFFHTKKIINFFMKAFSVAHANLFFEIPLTKPVATKSNVLDTGSLWLTDNGDIQTINAYSHCEVTPINAYFSPNDATICMGYDESVADSFAIVQDPSVIYHETGHLLVHSMLNQRNIKNDGFTKTTLEFQSSLGKFFTMRRGQLMKGLPIIFPI